MQKQRHRLITPQLLMMAMAMARKAGVTESVAPRQSMEEPSLSGLSRTAPRHLRDYLHNAKRKDWKNPANSIGGVIGDLRADGQAPLRRGRQQAKIAARNGR